MGKVLSLLAVMTYVPLVPSVVMLKGSIKVFPGSTVLPTTASKQERKSRQSAWTVTQFSILNWIMSIRESLESSLTLMFTLETDIWVVDCL